MTNLLKILMFSIYAIKKEGPKESYKYGSKNNKQTKLGFVGGIHISHASMPLLAFDCAWPNYTSQIRSQSTHALILTR